MVTDNFNIEFGYELIGVIPYAYWLHLQGDLEETVSSFDSSPLYYFSPKHTERKERRHSRRWKDFKYAYDNGNVHKKELDTSRWVPPPYKEHYKNSNFQSSKPLLIVTNKLNKEWGCDPINFLDVPALEWIFETFGDAYRIVYSRFYKVYEDTVDDMDLKEWDMVRANNITTLQELKEEMKYSSYNLLQMHLYACCDNFITVQGGSSILANFFCKKNIVFAKKGMEVKNNTYSWYHLLGRESPYLVNSYDMLKDVAGCLF